MFKEVVVHAHFNERTGYGIHASRFFPQLDQLVQKCAEGKGSVHISLLDTVSAAHTTIRHPAPSILYNVWESTEQPAELMNKLNLYDQLWVPSEWQRACSIAQGIPEEFVKVVPEGVDPEVYKPAFQFSEILSEAGETFNFVHVGQWQPRKSTNEICEAFLKAFPIEEYPDIRLYLSVDTLFPSDTYKSTEERLEGYGFKDPRFIVVHFEEREDYIRRLQAAHVFVSCARSEGWNLPLIEAMACGIPSIMADFGGSTEYAGRGLNVKISELRKPHGIYGNWDVPGQWGEPDYNHLVEVMKDAYVNYTTHKDAALETSEYIRTNFSWEAAAKKAFNILEELSGEKAVEKTKIYQRKCSICGLDFETKHRRKNLCSFSCRQEANKKAGLRSYHERGGWEGRKDRRNKQAVINNKTRKCIVCGWDDTVDIHHDVGEEYILCPNHHALITRGQKTIDDLLNPIDKVADEVVYNYVDETVDSYVDNSEDEIRKFARKQGYEIVSMRKRSAIFTVDSHPDTPEKLSTLIETIKQLRPFGYPILLSSHFALPADVIAMADFYIYDKNDILSGDDKPTYWRTHPDGKVETVQSGIPCHAAAALQNIRNAVDFCKGKYDWIYQVTSDAEVDIGEWLDKVHSSEKDLIAIRWENQPETFSGQIVAARTEVMDKITLRIPTWAEFARIFGDDRFCSEKGSYRMLADQIGLENVEWLTMDVGNRFNQVDKNAWKDDMFLVHFVEGPYLHINGLSDREYDVTYTTPEDSNVYSLRQRTTMWSRPNIKYFRDWTIKAHLNGELKYEHRLDLKGKRVLISMGSKALGDTLAWMPYVEEFRKKHECHVICSGWWTDIFDYPEIEFVPPGTGVSDIYASYDIGCFDDQLDRNVVNWRETTLQKVSSDILGLEYQPLRSKLKYEKPQRGNGGAEPKPYICFSEFSTMRNKLWNREGAWQKIIDYVNSLGYDCVSISAEKSALQNVFSHNGQTIQDTIKDISGASFYIGLNAGPSWIAYSLDIPCIMITGVSEVWNDFPNPYRVAVDVGCKPCFNDPTVPIDRGWEWCPSKKDYACTREITEELVIEYIDKLSFLREDLSCRSQSPKIRGEITKFPLRGESTQNPQPRKKRNPKRGSSTPLTTDGSQPKA